MLDTLPDAERVLDAATRRRAPMQRLLDALRLSDQLRAAAMNAARRRYPDGSVALLVAELTIVAALAAEGIPSMLTGSVAAAFRGATRATMDVDPVIEPTAGALERLVGRTLELGYYASIDAAREALKMRALFNVIDPESDWKADLIVRKLRAFSEAEFARRETVDFLGVPVAVARGSPHHREAGMGGARCLGSSARRRTAPAAHRWRGTRLRVHRSVSARSAADGGMGRGPAGCGVRVAGAWRAPQALHAAQGT